MDLQEKNIRQRLKDDFTHYANKCLRIRSKRGDIKPFELNRAQKYLHECVEKQRNSTGKVRIITLKGRQQGCSTYIEGRFYWRVTHSFGKRAFILTHEEDATRNLFEMAQRYHEHCPDVVKPTTRSSNAKELIFAGLDSGYRIGTAGNKTVGRSSTVQFLHASECAFYSHAAEHAKGIMQTVPSEPGTEIFIESTANGLGNYFHQQWQLAESGESEFIAVFIPWFWQDEYRKEVPIDFHPDEYEMELKKLYELDDQQLAWRRIKIIELSVSGSDGLKAFKQEYPLNAVEAFQVTGEDCFISPESVMAARQGDVDGYGALLLGVDPARFGDDRTAIIRRKGRKAFGLERYVKKDLMEVVGIVHNIIEKENPRFVFVDVGGLGAGVVDRLNELGHRDIIIAVNSGAKPFNPKKYLNKRAEMWGLCKDWLAEAPVQIPDENSLHADLCGIRYSIDSNSRLVLEKKVDMKKRGIRSPDEAESLILTFALPDSALKDNKKKENDKAKLITSNTKKLIAYRASRKW